MKRIYRNNDIEFMIPEEIYQDGEYKFYTLNKKNCITKGKYDIKNKVIYLEWSELNKLERGVLNYSYSIGSNKKDNVITDYYIMSGNAGKNAASWGNITGYLEDQTDLMEYLDQLMYKDLKIESFKQNPSIAEKGTTLNKITFSWRTNNKIKRQFLNDIEINPNLNSYTLEGSFTSDVQNRLTVDDGTKTATAVASLKFYPKVFYGDADILTDITLLNSTLRSNRYTTITVDAKDYIYICIPVEFGKPAFFVNGFEGGFELLDSNYKYNSISYYIYRSDYAGLGNTTITIK